MFSLNVNNNNIKSILNGIKTGKAVGLDGVPNEFLKFGGDTIIHSLYDLFVAVSDLEIIPK